MKIALVGNPNSGKTTMFNQLTGGTEYIGNWPGVTVEKKEGRLKANKNVIVTDLPGIYSLSPYSPEEIVTRKYLLGERPDVIINIVDATNLERNLYLTTQIIEMGIPTVLALNMMDVVEKSGDLLDAQKLGAALGCAVAKTSARNGDGLKELVELAVKSADNSDDFKCMFNYRKSVAASVEGVAQLLPKNTSRFILVKLLEGDYVDAPALFDDAKKKIAQIQAAMEQAEDDDAGSIISGERYGFVSAVLQSCYKRGKRGDMTTSDKIDRVVTHRVWALPIFGFVMWAVYFISVSSIGRGLTDWTKDVLFGEYIGGNVAAFLQNNSVAPWLQSLVIDGILAGVGAVLSFVPQIFILFFFLSILEDCGYMSRVAFIMDRIFRKFGLSGKSFIPMLIGSGCGVPGIMASRTVENQRDRRMTIIVTTFIPCSAKLPIIALVAGALFPGSGWVAPFAYFLGVAMIVLSGIILKKTKLFSGDPSPFVMELPQYRMPQAKGVFVHMWERGKSFIVKAGTVIFISCGIVWFLQSFNWSLQMVDAGDSMLSTIGNFIAPIFVPLGFGNWQSSVATLTGLVAKENLVGTFGVLLGSGGGEEANAALAVQISSIFTPASALAFMAFNLLCAPCFAAIGAIRREMGNLKWTVIAIAYQTVAAYVVSFIIYQIASVFVFGVTFGAMTVAAIVALMAVAWLVVRRGAGLRQQE